MPKIFFSFLASTLILLASCSKRPPAGPEPKPESKQHKASSVQSSASSGTLTEEIAEDEITDERDGKKYKVVKIGNHIWMAENLKYNAGSGSRCYEDKPNNCTKYGRLYNWHAAIKACPQGWHLSSDEEWNGLIDYAGGVSAIATLKAKSGWEELGNLKSGFKSGNGTDDFGFSALPGGMYLGDQGTFQGFQNIGSNGYWWTSTEYKPAVASWIWTMDNANKAEPEVQAMDKTSLSIRCVKDY